MSNLVQSKAFKTFPLFVLIVAALVDLWAIVLCIGAMSDSAVGGVVGLLLAILLGGAIAWRIRVRWEKLHSRSA